MSRVYMPIQVLTQQLVSGCLRRQSCGRHWQNK